MASIPIHSIFTLTVSNITDEAGNPVTPSSIRINDNDNDGMADDWEAAYNIDNPSADPDNDGADNYTEYVSYTDPYLSDTDGDGINDGDELVFWGNSWDADIDGDGLINILDPDADGDGLTDGFEVGQGHDPATTNYINVQDSWADYRVGLKMRSDNDEAMGVMFRYQDADNYYRFSWNRNRPHRRLVKAENGVFTLLAEDAVPYIPGQTYGVEIVAEGSVLEVWIDSDLVFVVTDPTFSDGTTVLYSWKSQEGIVDEGLVEDLFTGYVSYWEFQ